jgi:hypothetical protein
VAQGKPVNPLQPATAHPQDTLAQRESSIFLLCLLLLLYNPQIPRPTPLAKHIKPPDFEAPLSSGFEPTPTSLQDPSASPLPPARSGCRPEESIRTAAQVIRLRPFRFRVLVDASSTRGTMADSFACVVFIYFFGGLYVSNRNSIKHV